jgi:Icc-related predicted phosphoesterase
VRHELDGEDELTAFEQAVIRRGYYPFRTTPEQLDALANDPERLDAIFHERMLSTVERWMQLAAERLGPSGVPCYVCPGNDDQPEVDEIIRDAPHVELAEGRVVDVHGYQLASTGWANITPWKTYREEDEETLGRRIAAIVENVTAPPERTIFSFHCPPYGTGLDDAPALDEDLNPLHAGRAPSPCGSTAVRAAIESFGPTLSLHGHIHESRGATRLGRTLCINPGSSYEQGQLLGAVVELDGGKKVKRYLLTSG